MRQVSSGWHLWCVVSLLLGASSFGVAETKESANIKNTAENQEAPKAEAVDAEAAAEEAYARTFLEEEALAKKATDKFAADAAFEETGVITLPAKSGAILAFCVRPAGGLAVISGTSERYGSQNVLEDAVAFFAGKKSKAPNRVQWLTAAGEVEHAVDLSFKPLAINAAPNGHVYVSGEGKLLVFNDKFEKLQEVESPHAAEAIANREKFAQEVMERHQADLEQQQEHVKQMEEALAEIEAKPEEERSKAEQRSLLQTKTMVKVLQSRVKQLEELKEEQLVSSALLQLKEIHRVAISERDVFVVTRETSGYGYAVWRLNADLTSPKKIVSKLSGCCGQMDIQVIPEGLSIAENSRHRVLVVDREGKTVSSFGKSSRTDPSKGFGGCCNPMNTCCTADGLLLTSESNGLVKSFKPNGEFVSVVGLAKVQEGCKNSSIGISAKGDQLYYFDVEKGRVILLTKKV